jgi:hypothetical protein
MDARILLDREKGVITGKLIMPLLQEIEQKTLTINNLEIIFRFGDLFQTEYENAVIVVPNYMGGMIKTQLMKLVGDIYIDANMKYQIVEVHKNNITHGILYKYSMSHRLDDELYEIIKLCPSNSTLILPTLGLNNGISCYGCAFNIFYSLISCIENYDVSKIKRIVVMTKYDNGIGNRAIGHFFNLINVYNQTRNHKQCIICCSVKVDKILGCGHYAICSRCVLDLKRGDNKCPICKVPISYQCTCYMTEDSKDYACCVQGCTQKELKICVPCGHYNVACHDCGETMKINKKCIKCGMVIFGYLPYYDS